MQITSIDIPEARTQESADTEQKRKTPLLSSKDKALSINVKVLQYLGLIPLDGPSTWAHRLGRLIPLLLLANSAYSTLLAIPVEIYYVGREGGFRVVEDVGYFIYCVHSTAKLSSLMLDRRRLRAIISRFDAMFEREEAQSDYQKNILYITKRLSNFMTIFATTASLSTVCSSIVVAMPVILSTREPFLRPPLPFDQESFPGFQITIVYWLITHILYIVLNSVCDGLYIVFFIHIIAHYKILNHKVESCYADVKNQTSPRSEKVAFATNKLKNISQRGRNIIQDLQKFSKKLTSSFKSLGFNRKPWRTCGRKSERSEGKTDDSSAWKGGSGKTMIRTQRNKRSRRIKTKRMDETEGIDKNQELFSSCRRRVSRGSTGSGVIGRFEEPDRSEGTERTNKSERSGRLKPFDDRWERHSKRKASIVAFNAQMYSNRKLLSQTSDNKEVDRWNKSKYVGYFKTRRPQAEGFASETTLAMHHSKQEMHQKMKQFIENIVKYHHELEG